MLERPYSYGNSMTSIETIGFRFELSQNLFQLSYLTNSYNMPKSCIYVDRFRSHGQTPES